MKKFLSTLLALVILNSTALASSTDSGCSHNFVDTAGHWAEEEICALYEDGIVSGYSNRNFLPDQKVTRAEFLKMALLSLGYNVTSKGGTFIDVEAGTWYYSYITFAYSKGFVSGYSDGSFHPNSNIVRAEAVSLITTIAGIIHYGSTWTFTQFSDVSQGDWFATAVAVAIDYDIVEGYGDGSFRPYNELTRAEAAVIIDRTREVLH